MDSRISFSIEGEKLRIDERYSDGSVTTKTFNVKQLKNDFTEN